MGIKSREIYDFHGGRGNVIKGLKFIQDAPPFNMSGAFGEKRKGVLSWDKKFLFPRPQKTDSLLTTVKNQIIIKLSTRGRHNKFASTSKKNKKFPAGIIFLKKSKQSDKISL